MSKAEKMKTKLKTLAEERKKFRLACAELSDELTEGLFEMIRLFSFGYIKIK